jgi:methylase of polypeptide subunit release factors
VTSPLHDARLEAVRDVIRAARARSVLDLGCGDGALLALLIAEPSIERLVGLDVSLEALALARQRLGAAAAPDGRVGLVHGSFTQPDPRLAGFASPRSGCRRSSTRCSAAGGRARWS